MLLTNQIQHLTRKEINIERWNECISSAANGLIYSYSFYLDAMCDNWDAFIVNDYEAVMPLPWRKKAGIKYLYTPPFIQQLGVTGNHEIFDNSALLIKIKELFIYGDIFFNYSHSFIALPVSTKTNYILDLRQPFHELETRFANVLKKNLNTAKKNELHISTSDARQIIGSFQNKYHERMPHVRDADFNNFAKLCDQLLFQNRLAARSIQNKENEIMAAVILIMDKKRIYTLINYITARGRKMMANHVLLKEVLKEFSESDLLFDFEGSDLPGVKEFYEYFAPVNQPYFHYHFNYLPFPLNVVKK